MAALSPYVVISLYALKSDYNYNWPSPHSSSYLDTSDICFCKNISPNIWEKCFSNCSKYWKFIKLTSKMSLDCMNWRSEQSVLISCNWHASILCLWDWDCLSWSIRECGNVRAEPGSGHCLLLDNHLFNYFYTSLIWPFSPLLPFVFEPNYRKLSFYPTSNCYFLKL